MKKPFGLGITVGRFQTFHNGHKDMLDKALALCETVGVFIGSAQESGTFKNPFSYETRADMIRRIYGDRLVLCPLPDIGVGNNATWGNYVLQNVEERFGKKPDLLISGKETRRIDWFDSVEGLSIAELYVPKTVEISATRMRTFFLEGDRESWKTYTDPALWDLFDALREQVIAAQGNLETASL